MLTHNPKFTQGDAVNITGFKTNRVLGKHSFKLEDKLHIAQIYDCSKFEIKQYVYSCVKKEGTSHYILECDLAER